MAGNDLMGDPQIHRVLQRTFLQKERGQPLIEALPHDLLHEPHDIGEPGCHEVIDIVCHNSGVFHQMFIDMRRNDPEFRLLFCGNSDIKLNTIHHAGGGKQTGVHFKQTVDRHFPALFGIDIGPQLTGTNNQKSHAQLRAIMKQCSSRNLTLDCCLGEQLLLTGRQFIIYGKIL